MTKEQKALWRAVYGAAYIDAERQNRQVCLNTDLAVRAATSASSAVTALVEAISDDLLPAWVRLDCKAILEED